MENNKTTSLLERIATALEKIADSLSEKDNDISGKILNQASDTAQALKNNNLVKK